VIGPDLSAGLCVHPPDGLTADDWIEPPDAATRVRVVQACLRCPVLTACRNYALTGLELPVRTGPSPMIVGGLSVNQIRVARHRGAAAVTLEDVGDEAVVSVDLQCPWRGCGGLAYLFSQNSDVRRFKCERCSLRFTVPIASYRQGLERARVQPAVITAGLRPDICRLADVQAGTLAAGVHPDSHYFPDR